MNLSVKRLAIIASFVLSGWATSAQAVPLKWFFEDTLLNISDTPQVSITGSFIYDADPDNDGVPNPPTGPGGTIDTGVYSDFNVMVTNSGPEAEDGSGPLNTYDGLYTNLTFQGFTATGEQTFTIANNATGLGTLPNGDPAGVLVLIFTQRLTGDPQAVDLRFAGVGDCGSTNPPTATVCEGSTEANGGSGLFLEGIPQLPFFGRVRVVPVPPALPMFAFALIGAGIYVRRRKATTNA
ncbi:MAG: hypothetical protein AAF401_03435 [Pseudomonadota bacterium]